MFIACADLHIGSKTPAYRTEKNWIDVCLGKFQQIVNTAKKLDCPIVIAGDFFDKSACTPELINKICEIISWEEINFFMIPGNHDLKNHSLDLIKQTNIQTLAFLKNIYMADFPSVFVANSTYMDFYPYGNEKQLKNSNSKIAVIHKFAYKGKPSYETEPSGNYKRIINKLPGYKLIICGDNHEAFIGKYKETTFLNCGCMLRDSKDQMNYSPAYYIIDDDLNIKTKYFEIEKNVFDIDAINMVVKKDNSIIKIAEQMKKDVRTTLDFPKNMRRYWIKNKIEKEIREPIKEAMEI